MLTQRKIRPAFFPAVLSFCLLIGAMSNVISRSGLAIIITVIMTLVCTHLLAKQINTLSRRQVGWILGIGLTFMLLAQIYIVTVMPDTVFHDPYRVLAQADQMAAGSNGWHTTYFWRATNNVPLAYLLSLWLRLTQALGLSTNVGVHTLSILLLDGFIGLLLRTVWQLSKRNSVLLASFAFCALTPFAYTYYLQVFYSDLPAMLALLVTTHILLQWPAASRRYHLLAGTGLVITTVLGAIIKPNMIVMLPALAIVALLLANKKLLKKTKLLLPMLLIVCGFALTEPSTQLIDHVTNYTPNATYEFPITHWVYMGLNDQKYGMYNHHDVRQETKRPNKAARQKFNHAAIPRRIQKLGPVGLAKLWLLKLGILLNVRDVGHWYNGGFQSAPAWYNQHVEFYQTMLRISYCTAMIVLALSTIPRLLQWRPDLRDSRQVVILTAVITALGYLAFHTLLWETEPRYGQVILPLVWVALAASPVPATAPVRKRKAGRILAPILTVAPFVAASAMALGAGRMQPNTAVIAAQRSQLSAQYHAKPLTVFAGERLSQEVRLSDHANYFSVQIHRGAALRVTLVSLSSGHHYQLHAAGDVYRIRRPLCAGRYRISVRNTSGKTQYADIVHTYHYQLASHPLVIDGRADKMASFIYTCKLNH